MDEGVLAWLDKMSSELDMLVHFMHLGIESLVAGMGKAAPAVWPLLVYVECCVCI